MRRMACPGALADPSCPEVLAPQTTHAERFTGVSRNLKRAALTRMDRAFDPAKGGRILLARAVHERHFFIGHTFAAALERPRVRNDRALALTEFETTFGDRLTMPQGDRRSCPESVPA